MILHNMPPEDPNNLGDRSFYQQEKVSKYSRRAKWRLSGQGAHASALDMSPAKRPCTFNSKFGYLAAPSPAVRPGLLASVASCAAAVRSAPSSASNLARTSKVPSATGERSPYKSFVRRRHVSLIAISSCGPFKSSVFRLVDPAQTLTSRRILHVGLSPNENSRHLTASEDA